MADYYSILKKTISGLPANTAQNRRVVYEKASLAIDRQLRSLNPPPTEEAIARQMASLGQAIEQMEREYRLADQAAARAPAQPAAAPAQAPSPRPAPAAPQATARPAMPAGVRPAAQPPLAGSAQPPQRPSMATPQRPAPPPQRREPDVGIPPVASADNPDAPVAGRPASPRPAAPAAQPGGPRVGAAQPRPQQAPLAGSAPPRQPAPDVPAFDDSLDSFDDFAPPPPGRDTAQPRRPAEPARRGSGRVLSLVVALVVLALIGGGAYALWQNREPLMAALGLGEQPAQPGPASPEPAQETGTQETAPAAEQAGEPAPAEDDKEDARLSQSGQTVPGQAEVPPAREAGQPTEPQTDTQTGLAPLPGTEEDAADESVQVNPVDEGQQLPGLDDSPDAAEATPAPGAPAAPAENAELPAIAQKAYLYEEGTAGAGATRDNAAVVWTLANESPAEDRPPEAVIRGKFDVPGRGLVLNVTIKRNVDEALPASHIIELAFESPADFTGGSIDNVARFVMKSSEQARGEGLIAVPAKIDTGYFLIALNNLAQAVETNRKLLIDSTWIDIPIGYTSGKRALVTLEKGAIGDKVFRDAFADWDAR